MILFIKKNLPLTFPKNALPISEVATLCDGHLTK